VAQGWPEDWLESVAACLVCGHRDRTLLYGELEDKVFFSAPGKWNLHTCDRCGAVFLDPRPTRAAMAHAYRSYYTHEHSQATGGLRGLLDRWLPGGTSAAQRIVGDLGLSPGSRCLDVGCGEGALLRRMRAAGLEVCGVDPDPVAVAVARDAGLSVVEGTLDDETFERASFDAVTLNHAIEHLHDPGETLRICRSLLAPGGRLWIATPNLDSGGHRRFGRHWLHLDPPRHLVLFTRASLTSLVSAAGFTRLRFRPSRTATLVYPASVAIALGEKPMEFVPPRSVVLRARLVDLFVSSRPRRSEELVLTADRD
jgi:2-polyprenyl-3-methyl-5-hydroxy-6-metoxy-1,4-benzoquinol methylase